MLDNLIRQGLESNSGYAALASVLEKEILHHDILTVMSEHQLFTNLTFIGGTALRLCYNSARLSEDLDFSASKNFDVKTMKGFSAEIEFYLKKKYQLDVEVKEPKPSTSDTSTWKVSILKKSNRPDIPTQKIHIDICSVASLGFEFSGLKNHYGLPVSTEGLLVSVQSREEILADKFIALAYRNRIKPRDLWDILWLKQQGINFDINDILQKLKAREKQLHDFNAKLVSITVQLSSSKTVAKEFQNEMSRFLPEHIANRTINNVNFWPYLVKEVKSDINDIFNQANHPKSTLEFDMGER